MSSKRKSLEYLAMVARLWGTQISGPILALVAIVAAFVNARYANDATATAIVARWIAWSTGGISALLILVAQYQAWSAERDKYETEKSKNEAAPHMDIVDLNVVPHGRLGEGLTDLFFNVRLVLGEPSQVSIQGFSLDISNEATSLTVNGIEDVTEWSLVKPVGGFSRSPCVPLTKEMSRRGDPVQGWVHFKIPNLSESAVERCTLIFKVNCVHGTCYLYLPGSRVRTDADGKGMMMKLPS